jgi:hypothetical protein
MRITVVLVSLALSVGPLRPARVLAGDADPRSRVELEVRQRRIEKRMLRIQQERFEARGRGESTETTDRLGRQLRHSQSRYREVTQALEREQP